MLCSKDKLFPPLTSWGNNMASEQSSPPNFGAGNTKQEITVQKMKFSIKDSFSKCDQIRSFLRILSHLLKTSLMENLIFVL